MFCYYICLPLGIGMLICIIYTKSHDCYLNRATKNSVMEEYEKVKEDETVTENDIQEHEAIDIMADAADVRVKVESEDGQPSVAVDEEQLTNGLNNCAILIECETVDKHNGDGEQNVQLSTMWFRARVIYYVLPITAVIFNISTVAFTPAHIFSSQLGDSLDTVIASSLAFSMFVTITGVPIFLREEGEHVLLFAIFYLNVNSYLVFYIYSNIIFLNFAAYSGLHFLLFAFSHFLVCCGRSCKRKNNGSNGIV